MDTPSRNKGRGMPILRLACECGATLTQREHAPTRLLMAEEEFRAQHNREGCSVGKGSRQARHQQRGYVGQGRAVRCGVCHKEGHNRRSCPGVWP